MLAIMAFVKYVNIGNDNDNCSCNDGDDDNIITMMQTIIKLLFDVSVHMLYICCMLTHTLY